MTACEHRFVYAGVKYKDSRYPRPGSGAHDRYYYDHYYCDRCIEHCYEQLPTISSTYEPPLFNATPQPGQPK